MTHLIIGILSNELSQVHWLFFFLFVLHLDFSYSLLYSSFYTHPPLPHAHHSFPFSYFISPFQHTETHKRKVVEWETRCASARADRALKRLIDYSASSLAPFDRLVRELTVLMAQQATQVTAKMQGVLNNRDNEIMQRKARIHKRLSKHVTRTCHARRSPPFL